jgi:toxin YhaV
LVIHGWTVFAHPLFQAQIEALARQVETLKQKDPAALCRGGTRRSPQRSARTRDNTRLLARSDEKKPQPRVVGASGLVVGLPPAPNLDNSALYSRRKLLRSGTDLAI